MSEQKGTCFSGKRFGEGEELKMKEEFVSHMSYAFILMTHVKDFQFSDVWMGGEST